MDLINKITSTIGNIGKPPQPYVEPDFQNMTKEQQDRWAEKQKEEPGFLSRFKSVFGSSGGRRPTKKPKKPKKKTKNKRR
jgi:hypothetical protein